MTSKMLATMATVVVASIALWLPAVADAQLTVQVEGLKAGERPALRSTTAVGTLSPFIPGEWVRVQFLRDGTVVSGRQVQVRAEDGMFRLRSPRLNALITGFVDLRKI